MTATIGLEDVRIHAPHGFYEEEHRTGNEFSIDVEVESNILGAATRDDLGSTVNYSTIYYLLQAEMKKPTQLLEALAYRMAARIQRQFPQVSRVRLRLRKLNPPLGGQVGAAVIKVSLGPGSVSPDGSPVFDETTEPSTINYGTDIF
ncbi:MAG: dihydroneopterin aldolase [Bacteroidota bacterium]